MIKKFQKIFFSAILLTGLITITATTLWLSNRAEASYYPIIRECHWELTLVKVQHDDTITLEERIQFLSERFREWEDWEIMDHSPVWDWVIIRYKVCKEVDPPGGGTYIEPLLEDPRIEPMSEIVD